MLNKIRMWLHKFLFAYDFEFILLDSNAQKPTRAYDNDAGFDLYVSQTCTLAPGQMLNVPTGVKIKSLIPVWLLLIGRSSTMLKHSLIVDQAVIDHGYEGELYVKVLNVGKEPKALTVGMRIAQIVPIHHTVGRFKQVVAFSEVSDRGARGFGSSGV